MLGLSNEAHLTKQEVACQVYSMLAALSAAVHHT